MITKDPILDDGQLHRFRVEGDKAGKENGWYVLHGGDISGGAFGCWKRGVSEIWCSKNQSSMTPAERETYERQRAKVRQQKQEEEELKHETAAKDCKALWEEASHLPQQATWRAVSASGSGPKSKAAVLGKFVKSVEALLTWDN